MTELTEFQRKLSALLPDVELRFEEALAKHTSFRIGGDAEVMAFPKTKIELADILKACAKLNCKCAILGAGTNVLAPDEGLREVVVCTKDALLGLTGLGGGEIEAGAGETLSKTAVFARNLGLTGLEFAHGIPGTVGGGIYMNAGAYGGEMKQAAVRTTALSMDGAMRVFSGDEQGFSYRTSAFENLDMIIVKTVFRLLPGQTDAIAARMQSLMEKRRASQPLELPSAGSTFKRPEGYFAGKLIMDSGLASSSAAAVSTTLMTCFTLVGEPGKPMRAGSALISVALYSLISSPLVSSDRRRASSSLPSV